MIHQDKITIYNEKNVFPFGANFLIFLNFLSIPRPSEFQIDMVRPSVGSIKPIYQILLTYTFHQTKTDEICCEVPLLSHNLYENEYQTAFWMLFEANSKRFLLAGDCFPVLYKYTRSLEKGDYVIRLHVRHERTDQLEKLKETVLYVRHQITGTISQDIFSSVPNVLKGTCLKKNGERIQKNSEKSYFLGPIAEDKLPKGVANGHFLVGELSLFKDATVNLVDNHRISYQINNYGSVPVKKTEKAEVVASSKASKTLSDASVSSSEPNAAKNLKNKTDEDKLKESIRDIKVAHILK